MSDNEDRQFIVEAAVSNKQFCRKWPIMMFLAAYAWLGATSCRVRTELMRSIVPNCPHCCRFLGPAEFTTFCILGVLWDATTSWLDGVVSIGSMRYEALSMLGKRHQAFSSSVQSTAIFIVLPAGLLSLNPSFNTARKAGVVEFPRGNTARSLDRSAATPTNRAVRYSHVFSKLEPEEGAR
jgi:hypothetical protein